MSGTEFDPRRSTTAPRQYTTAQLRAYRNQLSSFLDRRNQFVPDASRAPIPRAEYQRYKQAEARYASAAGDVYERLKNTPLPGGQTVAERMAAMTPMHKTMHNTAANRIFDPVTRDSGDIVSRAAMRKLEKAMRQNSSPQAIRRKVQSARDQFKQMMETINMPELAREVKGLSNDQFVALWNFTSFATQVSFSYQSAKKMLTPKEQSWGHEAVRQQMEDAMELVDWARKL